MRPEIKPAPIPTLTLAFGTAKPDEVLVAAVAASVPVLVSVISVVPVTVPEVKVEVATTRVVFPPAVALATASETEDSRDSTALESEPTAVSTAADAESTADEASAAAEVTASVAEARASEAPGMTSAGLPVVS